MQIDQEKHLHDLLIAHKKDVFFRNGLKGYETVQEYFISLIEGDQLTIWIEAVGFDNLTFIAFNPYRLCQNYNPEIHEEDLKELEMECIDDLFLLCIANTRNIVQPQVTINLTMPIVINYKTGKGKQVLLKNGYLWSSEYGIVNE
jgi:flagellar assembly factor FliW